MIAFEKTVISWIVPFENSLVVMYELVNNVVGGLEGTPPP